VSRQTPANDRLASLTPEQRAEVLARLRAQARGRGQERIEPRPRPTPLLASLAQERLWFLEELNPGRSTYNNPWRLRLSGRLDVDALRQALVEIVARHEVLRTSFGLADGRPVQTIASSVELDVPLTDLRSVPEGERETEAQRISEEEAARPFDISRAPLVRARVLRVGDEEHLLMLTIHHLVSDGWSFAILAQELATLYRDFREGRPSSLAPLRLQYADYALWQRDWLRDENLERPLEYWRERLEAVPPLELPGDRPRRALPTGAGAMLARSVPAAVTAPLAELAQREGATLFMALVAGLHTLLARYSGQDDVLIGTANANRNRTEIEALVGFFVNMLVLRADLSGEPSFRALLAQERERSLEAIRYQDLPFEKLVEALQPVRDPARTPFFQVALTLQNTSSGLPEFEGLEAESWFAATGSARFDLMLFVDGDAARGLDLTLEYSTELFDRATAERFLEHYELLLAAAVRDPDAAVTRLPMIGTEELRRIERLCNRDTEAGAPPTQSVDELFAEQVARSPDAPAVTFGDETVTYEELDRRAGRLANRLLALGVGHETPVALCLERSLDLVVAIVAVVKAGAAYVALDTTYPAERLAFMLEDVGAPVVITHEQAAGALPEAKPTTVWLDRDADAIAAESPDSPPRTTGPDDLLYVIYTSGSTGRPKGVLVEHGNVVRLLTATERWFAFGPEDVFTLFHSYAFDVSVWEMWGALLYGGRLVVVPWETSRMPDDFHDLLVREGVTVLDQTPTAFAGLMRADEASGRATELRLRTVIFAGEALDFRNLRGWLERHGEARPVLVNMYGITETTVHTTYRPLTLADAESSRSLIGRAIPDLRLHVVDRNVQPVPLGVPGELLVAGPGVARGYLNRPDVNRERFVPEPGGEGRCYRSGDLVRLTSDDDIEYLGRIDAQVKIRGFRIELGEIEAVLESQPGVSEAVVVAHGDGSEKRLVAYLVTAAGDPASADELRASLRRQLPEYMVPAAFVRIDRVPMTANGKVDRRALPDHDGADDGAGGERVGPRDAVEEIVADFWVETLETDDVGVHDDFFAVGGNSLQAARLVARIRETFEVELPVRALFTGPTVAGLAEAIRAAAAEPERVVALAETLCALVRSAGDGSGAAAEPASAAAGSATHR
jgi:amino acid adenylation domain-containing protein